MPIGKVSNTIEPAARDKTSVNTYWTKTAAMAPVFPLKYKNKNVDSRLLSVKTKADVCKLTGLSEDYINSLIKYEDFKLSEYKDSRGIETIGVGHNIPADSTYFYGKCISEEQGYKLLAKDLLKAKKDLKGCLGNVKLKTGQEEALVDLVFNVGIEKVKNTKLMKYVKSSQYDKATHEFDFITINGAISSHLVKRRVDNIRRFNQGRNGAESKKAIDVLIGKGLKSYDEKIKKANFIKSIYYSIQKDFYKRSLKDSNN